MRILLGESLAADDLCKALQSALAGRIEPYLERRRDELVRLSLALDARDFDRIGHIGHDLCGSGGMYGFDRLSRIGKNLEAAAYVRSAERIGQLISEYALALGQIAAAGGLRDAGSASGA